MVDRWPKGSRAPRPGSRAWLLDTRGRPYRLGNTVAFHVYFQPAEGKLWTRLYRDGRPLRLSALVSRTEFVDEVGNRDGAYQLQPVDAQERPIGDPPSMVFLPAPPVPMGPARDPIMSPREPAEAAVAPPDAVALAADAVPLAADAVALAADAVALAADALPPATDTI